MVNLSLEHGNSDGSCPGLRARSARCWGRRFGDYRAGFRFGKLGFDLVEKRGPLRFKARVYFCFAQHGQSLGRTRAHQHRAAAARLRRGAGDRRPPDRVLHAQRPDHAPARRRASRSREVQREAEDGARVRAQGEVRPGRRHRHRTAQADPDAAGPDRAVLVVRRRRVRRGPVRAAPARATRAWRSPRLVLDPQAAGALLRAATMAPPSRPRRRRGPCCGRRRRSPRSPSTISLRRSRTRRRTTPRRSDERPRASAGARRAPRAAAALGADTAPRTSGTAPRWSAAEIARHRRRRAERPRGCTRRRSARRATTASSRTRRSPTRRPRASTAARGFALIADAYLREARDRYCAGAPTARCASSSGATRSSSSAGRPASDDHRRARRAARSCSR